MCTCRGRSAGASHQRSQISKRCRYAIQCEMVVDTSSETSYIAHPEMSLRVELMLTRGVSMEIERSWSVTKCVRLGRTPGMHSLDIFAMGFVLTLVYSYENLLHAPDSSSVRRATFRSRTGDCYRLEPVVVGCI